MKNFFHISSVLFIFLSHFVIFDSIVCQFFGDLTSDDFWYSVFGEDVNQTETHKPLDHIKEELEYHYGIHNYAIDDKYGEQEMDFHVFNLHDFDKNKLLDGLEMLSMMYKHDNSDPSHANAYTFDRNTAVIDLVLKTEDRNNDGFLDYNEYKSAKSKHNLKGIPI